MKTYTIFDIVDCGKCQNGWKAFGNSCYFFANVNATWNEAQVMYKTKNIKLEEMLLKQSRFSRKPLKIQYC